MGFKAVLFDLDGTLLNTVEDLGDSMNRVLSRAGFPIHDIETYKYFVGWGIEKLVYLALPENQRDDATIAKYVANMRAEYSKHWADKTRPYDGIPELLDALTARGIKMAVLSNKPDDSTRKSTAKLLPNWRFEIVIGAREGVPKKPNPKAAFEIVKIIKIPPENFLYLGDTDIDMETATKAGMYPVGALWGFREADELKKGGAKRLISHPMELLELL